MKGIVLAGAVLAMASMAYSDVVFSDDFEGDALVVSDNPPGWTVFGSPITDKGTFTAESHSPSASVWVAVAWDAGWGWGATKNVEATAWDVTDESAWVSVWMRSTNDFTAGSVAMTIYDGDGTQWRTADGELFQLSTTWTEYRTPLSNMVIEAAGTTAGLDYTNIANFGFLAYTAGQSGDNMVQFDDFSVQTIPEAGTVGAVAVGVGVLMMLRRRRRL